MQIHLGNPIIIGILQSLENVDTSDFSQCGLIEIRFDLISNALNSTSEIKKAIKQIRGFFPNHSLMATIRLRRDGGSWPNDQSFERIKFFQEIIRSDEFDWIDIELEESALMELHGECLEHHVQILCSHHNFHKSYNSEELEALTHDMEVSGASAGKFALTFQDQGDSQQLYHFLNQRRDSFIFAAFSMGLLGKESRLIGSLLGAPGTYGFIGDKEAAPGQIKVNDMAKFLNSPEVEAAHDEFKIKSGLSEENRAKYCQTLQAYAQQFLHQLDD